MCRTLEALKQFACLLRKRETIPLRTKQVAFSPVHVVTVPLIVYPPPPLPQPQPPHSVTSTESPWLTGRHY